MAWKLFPEKDAEIPDEVLLKIYYSLPIKELTEPAVL
jgi:hypothetical protein